MDWIQFALFWEGIVFLLFLLTSYGLSDTIPAGQEIDERECDCNATGLSELGGGAAGVLLPAEPIGAGSHFPKRWDVCVNYEFALKDAEVTVDIDAISIVPSTDTRRLMLTCWSRLMMREIRFL